MAKKPFGWGKPTFPTVPELPSTSPDHPDADLPFADEIPETVAPEAAIPLDWEERELQQPRREKNMGAGEYQLPLSYDSLGAEADALFESADKGFSSSNIHAFAWTEARDKDHPARLWVWFQPLRKQTGGARKVGLSVGAITRYCYDRVDYAVFVGMRAASSKGTFLGQHVKKAGFLYHGPF